MLDSYKLAISAGQRQLMLSALEGRTDSAPLHAVLLALKPLDRSHLPFPTLESYEFQMPEAARAPLMDALKAFHLTQAYTDFVDALALDSLEQYNCDLTAVVDMLEELSRETDPAMVQGFCL